MDDVDLDSPVAANYFYCSNQTAVPDTFVAAPGQEYPGGNGTTITEGSNDPTPTSGSATATGSGMAPGSGTPTATSESVRSINVGNAALGMVLAIGVSWALI